MWKRLCVIFINIYCWSYVLSDDCITPLGKISKYVSLYDCPTLASVTNQMAMPNYIRSFLMQSHCGFQGNIIKPAAGSDKNTDGYSEEDSLLASRGQCGVDRDGDRIYSGKVAEYDDFPWMALLGYKNSVGVIRYKCGGSLINQRYVLTAAHCVIGYREEKHGPVTSVRLGEHDISAKPRLNCPYAVCQSRLQEIAVASTHAHPRYTYKDRSRTHDIAIVRLVKRAAYTCPPSSIKMKLRVPIFDKDTCIKMYQSRMNISLNAKQLCAGGIFKQDACDGDSGGPLMMKSPKEKWEAVGVISFGRGCGLDGWPGIYTSVGGYLEWIRKMLQSTNY